MIDLQLLASQAADAPAGYEGRWHAILFQPDLTSPQSFVIGVALTTRGKLSHFRIAQDASRLKCFYGPRFGDNTWDWLLARVEGELQQATAAQARTFVSASPQIHFSAGHFVAAADADSALNRTFERAVSLIAPAKRQRLQGVNQAELRQSVAAHLKRIMDIRYEKVAMPAEGLAIQHEGKTHVFDVNYDDHTTAASVLSGAYVSQETSRLNLMAAYTDLSAFSRIRKRDQIGLAVLLPSKAILPAEVVSSWMDWWDDYSYKLRNSSSVLLAEDTTAEGLALQVSHWFG